MSEANFRIAEPGECTIETPPHRGLLTISDFSGPVVVVETMTTFSLRHPTVMINGVDHEVPRKVSFTWQPLD